MSDRVLVTGVSGFLGGHVALGLLNAGYQVRGSVRDLAKADEGPGDAGAAGGDVSRLEFVALDLMSDAGWDGPMDGCRYLQHVASPFCLQMPKDRDGAGPPRRRRHDGVRSRRRWPAGVERIVLTSSVAAVMYGHPTRAAPRPSPTPTGVGPQGHDVNAYIESKTRAELEAWGIMERPAGATTSRRSTRRSILGPLLDDDPGTSADTDHPPAQRHRAGCAAHQFRHHRRPRRRGAPRQRR